MLWRSKVFQDFFVGFKVFDKELGSLGEIEAVDESTMNVLFFINKDGKEIILPAHEEFIVDLNKKDRIITVELPDGLIDL